jgi:hypothetical protein
MDSTKSSGEDQTCNVKVAVRCRPLNTDERKGSNNNNNNNNNINIII